jgi:hypothetical protein
MIGSIVTVIDRLIDLLDRRKKSARSTFLDHIEPLFLDLSTIHGDYLSSLREIQDLIAQSDATGMDLESEMRRRQEKFAPLRSKVIALANAIQSSDFDDPVEDFAKAVVSYFQLASEGSSTGYKTLLGMIDWAEALTSDYLLKKETGKAISEVRTNINDRWSELTQAYARVRLSLLSP